MVIKIEGRVDGFFFVRIFQNHFLYKISWNKDWPWHAICILYHRSAETNSSGPKIGKYSWIFLNFRMTHPLKLSFKQCSGTEIWYTKSPNNNLHNEGSKFCIWIQPAPLPGAAISWSHQTQSTSNASNSAKNWNLEKVPEFESHITSG